VTTGGTVVATYTYNALNQRIGVKDSGTQTWTVYDGTSADANPYADFNSSGSLTERYLFGAGVVTGAVVDEILARTSAGGTTAWYLTDNLGSVRDIVNTSGTVIDHIVYDSFGNIVTETNAANGDRFKFAGMEWDAAIAQYYDHARWYGPVMGRFTREDPTGLGAGDPDLYRYVGNEPTDSIDPSGLQAASPRPIPVVTGPNVPNEKVGLGERLVGILIPAPKNFLGIVASTMPMRTPPTKIGDVSSTGVNGGFHTMVGAVPPGSVTGSGGADTCIGLIITTPTGAVYVFHFTTTDSPSATLAPIRFPKGSYAAIFGGNNEQPSNETLQGLTPCLYSGGFIIDGYYPYDALFTDGSYPPKYFMPPSAGSAPVPGVPK
jgi:RHS repeat-associated protein